MMNLYLSKKRQKLLYNIKKKTVQIQHHKFLKKCTV